MSSQITGWKLNVIDEDSALQNDLEKSENDSKIFVEKLDVDKDLAQLLINQGYLNLESVSSATPEKLATIEEVVSQASLAKNKGASRFCMGAAWRQPKQKDLDSVVSMIKVIKDMNMESCVTLGMLSSDQARQLKDAGLDYYNHNIDSSPEYYTKIISTRDYNERLATLDNVREAGISVCCGGIIGMGESSEDRAGFLLTLANMPSHPESVPINMLVKVEGTPLNDAEAADPIEFVRIIAAARIMMPRSYIRLSAGRNDMSDEMQALCYLAGANSIFYGEKLLTTDNPQLNQDRQLLERLGIKPSKLNQ